MLKVELQKYFEKLKNEALKEKKAIGFSLEFPYKSNADYYLLPIRHSENCVIGAIKIFKMEVALQVLRQLDRKVDYIFLDAECKNKEFENIEEIAKKNVNSTLVLPIKVNDFTVLSADLLLSQMISPIKNKKIVIVGAGNIAMKLAIKLAERKARVFVTDKDHDLVKGKVESANSLLIKHSELITPFKINDLKNFNASDALIGLTSSSSGIISPEMVKRTKDGALILDGGIGTIKDNAMKLKRNFIRLDSKNGFYGYVDSVIKTDKFIKMDLGQRKIDKFTFVSGGKIGRLGDIIIDSIRNPSSVIALANGLGGIIRETLNNVKLDRKIREELMMPRFVFRVDGGSSEKERPRNEQGMGHIARSITLAQMLDKKGYKVYFIMKNLPGVKEVEKYGFETFLIDEDNELENVERILKKISNPVLILDKLEVDENYVKKLKEYTKKIVTFDNIGTGAIYADINFYPLYSVPKKFKFMNNSYGGPQYVIMKDSYYKLAKRKRSIKDRAKNILVSLGGTDPTRTTMKVIEALKNFEDIKVNIVVGRGFSFKEDIVHKIKNLPNFKIIENLSDLSGLIAESDLAILSGGITPYEAAFLGTPSVIICHNVGETQHSFKDYNFGVYLGLSEKINKSDIEKTVADLIDNKEKRSMMSAEGRAIFRGHPKDLIMDILLNN